MAAAITATVPSAPLASITLAGTPSSGTSGQPMAKPYHSPTSGLDWHSRTTTHSASAQAAIVATQGDGHAHSATSSARLAKCAEPAIHIEPTIQAGGPAPK